MLDDLYLFSNQEIQGQGQMDDCAPSLVDACLTNILFQGDGAVVEGVQLKVSMARRQPSFEMTSTEQSTGSWSTIGRYTPLRH